MNKTVGLRTRRLSAYVYIYHSGWTHSDRAHADLARSYTPRYFTPDCTNLDKSTLV